jgi:hypothetical protein
MGVLLGEPEHLRDDFCGGRRPAHVSTLIATQVVDALLLFAVKPTGEYGG